MLKIHYFNPGHETAVLLGKRNYTAPTNVRKMQGDLALLPAWYAAKGDFVYMGDLKSHNLNLSCLADAINPNGLPLDEVAISSLKSSSSRLEAEPWGVSPHSLAQFERLRDCSALDIIVPEWCDDYFRLTGRMSAALTMTDLREKITDLELPQPATFCTSIEELELFISRNSAPYIIKTPYSSSGRGLMWVHENSLDSKIAKWAASAISKQGAVSIELGLDKWLDFAMEFWSDGNGAVSYRGLSIFNTEERGSYSGNILEPQPDMEMILTQYVSKEIIERVKMALIESLSDRYGAIYRGCIGVDMLIYQRDDGYYAIHPCIEINMRYTMGYVALRLYEEYITQGAVGEYHVSYDKAAGEALRNHLSLSERYPLILEKGRIKSGYISLCPVDSDTNYRAFILIK